MSALEVQVLGPVRAQRDGAEVDLASPRQRSLLAALALSGGRPVSVSSLVEAVWDEEPPEGARTTLQTYVSRLRRLLGTDAVQHGPAGYRLDPAAVTDVGEVRATLLELDRGEPATAADRAELALAALDRWHGPALAELADRSWFRGPVTELAEMRARVVELAAGALLDAARPDKAVPLLESAVSENPLREPTVVLLVRALHGASRTTEALRAADRYRRELRDQTGLDPGPALVDVEQVVLAGGSPLVAVGDAPALTEEDDRPRPAPALSALPRAVDLVGRDQDLAELGQLVERSRLVTITGVGGVGKTSLLAELHARQPQSQRWAVVELATVTNDGIATAVAAALGYRVDRPDLATLAELLGAAELVLALDNCEHVRDEVRALVRELLARCPGLRVVTTSRARLDLPDELVLRLDPLATDGERSAAAVLFAERVHRGHPRSTVDPSDPEVRALCEHLDGVPLALELAASRAAALGVPALTRDLRATLEMLSSAEGAADRHADLATVVTWSVDLLGPDARTLLAALAPFQAEFDLDAAESVGHGLVEAPVPFVLGVLVDASLVAEGTAPGRYRLLEMIRRAAVDAALEDGRTEEVRRAHACWVADQLVQLDRAVASPFDAEVGARLDALRPDIGSAMAWAVGTRSLDVAADVAAAATGPLLYRPDVEVLSTVHACAVDLLATADSAVAPILAAGARASFLLGRLDDAERLAESALTTDEHRAARNRADHAIGVLELYRGNFQRSSTHFRAAADDPGATVVEQLDALGGLALALCYSGRVDEADAIVVRHRAMADTVDSDTYRSFAEYARAEIALARDDVEGAASCLESSAERAWQVGASFVWGLASTVLASVLVHHRPDTEARSRLPILLERWRRTATWPQLWTTLRLVAALLARDGFPEVALLVLLAADRDPAAPGLTGPDADRDASLRARLVEQLGSERAAGITASVPGLGRLAVLERALTALAATPREG